MCGLNVPQFKPMTLPTFADRVGVLTKDEIGKLITDPKRVAGRKRFGSNWIKNQGRRGSCNAYATASALERARDFRGKPRVELGPEFLYAMINGGRDSGSLLEDGREYATNMGIPPKSMVPYESFLKNQQSREAYDNAGRFKVLESYAIHSEEELASALALNFVGVIATHVTNNFMRLDGEEISGDTNGPGNHAECVDDVAFTANGNYKFDLPNSWGLQFGNQGRSYVTWQRHLRDTVNYHQFWVIKTTTDDPIGDPQLPKA